MNKKIKEAVVEHANQEYPNECCGVIVVFKGREKYIPCKNVDERSDVNFTISPEDLLKAGKVGEIVAYVHSHTQGDEQPSETDKISQAETETLWIIYSTKTEKFFEFNDGEKPPLYGREYKHGITDCFDFIRDFYGSELDIKLNNYFRLDRWWERGENMYVENYEKEGFRKIPMSEMMPGDVIVFSLKSNVPNHGAIYLGNNKIGHHLEERLSSIDIYGQFLRDRTSLILRHKEMDERHAKDN